MIHIFRQIIIYKIDITYTTVFLDFFLLKILRKRMNLVERKELKIGLYFDQRKTTSLSASSAFEVLNTI